jgi:hypothetical protein
MPIVAVIGDVTTTTTVALATAWPADDDVLVFEADRSGGSLAAWLDVPASPTLATVVANAGSDAGRSTVLGTIDAMTHRTATGIAFLALPFTARAATRAVEEAGAAVIPALAGSATIVLADVGRAHPGDPTPAVVRSSALTVVVHRQERASAAAESPRLERLVESVDRLARSSPPALAVVGDQPFDPAEIAAFVDTSCPGALVGTAYLDHDPLAASVFAGHRGVSAARLRRLPLVRSAASTATVLAGLLAVVAAAPDASEASEVAS